MVNSNLKIIRACTVSMSLTFLEGMLEELCKRYEVVLLSSPGVEMEQAKEKHGVATIAIPMERHISPKNDIIALWRIIKALRREKPQMVHSITPKAGLLCMMAARIARVPVRVHTFTGLVWPTETGWKRRILMVTDWLTCACATHIIPEGKGVMADLQNNGITKKPMRVLGHGNVRGIDLERFSKREDVIRMMEEKGLRGKSEFTFLFVGRIVRDKGINELVTAFDKLHKEYPGSRLVLVGRYEDELDPVSAWTRRIIEEGRGIEAVGEKLNEELIAYYAAADCYVFPSYREGFPNTVLEAGAMGLPCIVTDINGSREIIVEGENGVIIPPQNEQALYEAMVKMMTDEEGRKRMAGNARRMVAERFEQNYVRQCLFDFYESILGGMKNENENEDENGKG